MEHQNLNGCKVCCTTRLPRLGYSFKNVEMSVKVVKAMKLVLFPFLGGLNDG